MHLGRHNLILHLDGRCETADTASDTAVLQQCYSIVTVSLWPYLVPQSPCVTACDTAWCYSSDTARYSERDVTPELRHL